MTNPTGQTPDSAASSSVPVDDFVKQLLTWRDGLVREGRLQLGALKETHLRNAVLFGRRDPRFIAKVLPASCAHLADQILEVILSVDPVQPSPHARGDAGPKPGTGQASEQAPPPPRAAAEPLHRQPADPAGLAALGARFARYSFDEELGDPEPLTVRHAEGETELGWATASGGEATSVFRVVSGDDQDPPLGPEYGDLLDIGTNTVFVDTRAFTTAIRHYQVWRNSGPDIERAQRRQPRLHAEGRIVAPVQDVTLSESAGRVIGQWRVFPGTSKVHVFRIPIEHARAARLSPQFEILSDRPNLTGFVDDGVERGRRYLYRFVVEVASATQQSPVHAESIAVSAVLAAPDVPMAHGHGTTDEWLFDLSWGEPPAGQVQTYLTSTQPAPGIDKEVIDESALTAAGLGPADRIRHPAHVESDGRSWMRHVAAPARAHRVYFTAVTVLDGKARAAAPVSAVVIPPPTDAVIVERTDYQQLRFGWPGEAAEVAVGVTPTTDRPQPPPPGPYAGKVTRTQYERLGCYVFPRPLPPDGVSVHLAGASFVDKERVLGPAICVPYPGLLRIHYTIELRRGGLRQPEKLLVGIWSDRELPNCPPFVLVHHPTRLPLRVHDGTPLPTSLLNDPVAEPRTQFRPARLDPPGAPPVVFQCLTRRLSGYVRLFADLPADVLTTVAVLDPPARSLSLRG